VRSGSCVLLVCACVVSAVVPAAASAQAPVQDPVQAPAQAPAQAQSDATLLAELTALERASCEGVHKGKRLAQTTVESSSLYVRRDGKWLEIFYQETAIPGEAPPTK